MLEIYRNNHIETETDIYTGNVQVCWWSKESDPVKRGGFNNTEAAINHAKKEIDWFCETVNKLEAKKPQQLTAEKQQEYQRFAAWVQTADTYALGECKQSVHKLAGLRLFQIFKSGQEPVEAVDDLLDEIDKAGVDQMLEEAREARIAAAAEEAAADAFELWLHLVDEATWRMVGCSISDLPDADFMALYESGMEPAEASDTILMEAGYTR